MRTIMPGNYRFAPASAPRSWATRRAMPSAGGFRTEPAISGLEKCFISRRPRVISTCRAARYASAADRAWALRPPAIRRSLLSTTDRLLLKADLQARAIHRLYWVGSCRGGNQNAYVRENSCPMSSNDHIAEVEGQISSGSLAELLLAKDLTRSVRTVRMGAPYSQYPFYCRKP